MSDRIDALRQALESSPDNPALRLMLAEALAAEGRRSEALDEYVTVHEEHGLEDADAATAAQLALDLGRFELARELRGEEAELAYNDDLVPDEPLLELADHEEVSFADVGGLDDVKEAVNRLIIQPYRRPDLYLKYGRGAGGGVLMYGPPGCGKTMLARATAGECGLPFLNIRIEEILAPFIGQSEHNLHAAFAAARAAAPCVLFLDELDAIGFARRKHIGGAARPLVDQLLQELDAIGSDNRDLLILAATNAPWDVDEAMKRPGRFDRMIFVPPPDAPARQRILELLLEPRPTEKINAKALADATPRFSGADLRAAVDHALDDVIAEALASGTEPPLTMRHLERAIRSVQPSTVEWLATAKNYVDFANEGGRYDDVKKYLSSSEGRRR
ncbi:MAG TPA: tetratricopeptide repeat protein [Gaiellaceae bacterium]